MKYDVFLSYATVDNTSLATEWSAQNTWVMSFKVALQQAVDREFGRTGATKWFLDAARLRTGDYLREAIEEALDETKVVVALVSAGYFHDASWCKAEREYFIQKLGPNPERSARLLGVLLNEEALEDWKTKCFAGVRAFPFYSKNNATEQTMRLGEGEIDKVFMERISRLAKDVAAAIKEYTDSGTPPPPPVAARHKVVLAAVPGEIEEDRTELAVFLNGHGWDVVPVKNECPSTEAECEKATEELLKDAMAFVQLLSPHPWKPIAYDRAQDRGAAKSKKSIIRYRSDEIDLSKVKDADHRAWLDDKVRARSMLGLQEELLAELQNLVMKKQERENPPPPAQAALITLSVAEEDKKTLGNELAKRLGNNRMYAVMPSNFARFEKCLLDEHGLLTVFGDEPYYPRVEGALLEWRELLVKHDRDEDTAPPVGVYLTVPPPADKAAQVNIWLPRLRIIGGNSDLDAFIADVRAYATKKAAAGVK